MWDLSMETCVRRAFGEIGVFSRREVPVPASADERFSGIFFGRAAGNVDVFRSLGDRMPGSTADGIDEKLFGKEPEPGAAATRKPLSAYRRYPAVAVKMPRGARRAAKELRPMREEIGAWWRERVMDSPPQDLAGAQQLLRDAADMFMRVGELHTIATLLASALLEQLTALAEQATGDPALAMELATGYGAMEETALIEDLWAVARGSLDVDEAVRRHGYHGPDEGDLSSRTWREDRAPMESILRNYRKQDIASPREREERQVARRIAAEERLLSGLSGPRRPGARLVLKLGATYIPLREIGKAAFLHTLDAARCAARAGAPALVEAGVLSEPEDVFFLTFDEFIAPPDVALRAAVEERRERHARYQGVALPPRWQGDPTPVAIEPEPEPGAARAEQGAPAAQLRGIGVVGERVTGRARVIHDPLDADLDEGDILVCKTTDPSWTPLFMLAEALVIDTGGAMSHGAIVARELGVTCVINTVTGTREIPDGATITVDGATGVVEISGVPAPAEPAAG
jgi:pyruvate,water dikinase